MSTIINKLSKIELIGWSISIMIAAIILFVPETAIYTQEVKLFSAITVFILSVAAFELLPTFAISVLLPSLYMLFKVAPANVVFSPWIGTTMIMIFGAFFMAASLDRSGLLRRVAYWMMCKSRGSYFTLLVSIMCVGVVLNILTSGRGYLIIGPLAAGLCLSLGCMQKKLGAGIAAAAMLGGCTSHAYTFQVSAWSVLFKTGEDFITQGNITPFSIIMHNWPLFFVSIGILFVASKMFKPEDGLGEITYFREQLNVMGKITRREKVNAIMLGCLLLYIFTVSIHKLDINLGFALIPLIVFLPGVDGTDFEAVRDVNYSVILFVAACMSIGTVATHLGLGAVLMGILQGLLAGTNSSILLMAVVFGIVFLLNFLMTPLAIFALILTPVLTMAVDMGLSAIPFAYAINACSEAIIFPYEYVPYLVIYAFGMIKMKDFIFYNIMRSALFFIGFLVVVVPYWLLIGLL